MSSSLSTVLPVLPTGKKGVVGRPKVNSAEGLLADAVNPRTWQKFLGLVSSGVKIEPALKECQLSKPQLEGAIKGSHQMRESYDGAKLAALRRAWDTETIEEALTSLAMGRTVAAALKEALLDEPTEEQISSFMKLVLNDSVIKEAYEEARKVQAEMMADDIIAISDDGRNDTYLDDEGRRRVDHDVVNRSRLRLQARQWLMARLHYQRFGDRIQQDQNINLTVDHAERLANARKRIEARNAGQED